MTYEERQQEKVHSVQRWKIKQLAKRLIWVVLFGGVLFIGWKWLVSPKSSSSPGQTISDLGRKHVPEGETVEYNSNPPTSGPHYETWEKAGVYDKVLQDEKLVHSLEHGYVVISYNCGDRAKIKNQKSKIQSKNKIVFIPRVSAHEEDAPHDEAATESAKESEKQPSSVDISSWNDDPDCQSFVSELERIAKKLRLWKLIVVPRPNLDHRIALTAWTKLDTFDEPDEDRIARFVTAYRDKGPEKTME